MRDEPIDKITPFLHAQKVLEYLHHEGVDSASAKLYYDGSGSLSIHQFSSIDPSTQERITKRLSELLRSHRWQIQSDGTATLMSCCGWHP